MMLPWVVLGLILEVALLISIIYTAIMFFVNHDVISGVVWLVGGFIGLGEYIVRFLFTSTFDLSLYSEIIYLVQIQD